MNWQERDGAIWVEAGVLSSFSLAPPQRLTLSPSMPGWKRREDLEVFVVSSGDDVPLVLSSECTHQHCPVDWRETRFSCPCHGSAFDLEGKVLNGPATKPLLRPQVMIEGDSLWVRVRDQK